MNSPYELDETSKHLFCKYCGNNYLLHEHKQNCTYKKHVDELSKAIREGSKDHEIIK